jgi:hypothetical protein
MLLVRVREKEGLQAEPKKARAERRRVASSVVVLLARAHAHADRRRRRWRPGGVPSFRSVARSLAGRDPEVDGGNGGSGVVVCVGGKWRERRERRDGVCEREGEKQKARWLLLMLLLMLRGQ